MNDTELTAEERAEWRAVAKQDARFSGETILRLLDALDAALALAEERRLTLLGNLRAYAELEQERDAALARTEAAEQDLNWLRLTANAAEERTAANVRDKDSAITRLGMVEAQHRAAESALAEATALLERVQKKGPTRGDGALNGDIKAFLSATPAPAANADTMPPLDPSCSMFPPVPAAKAEPKPVAPEPAAEGERCPQCLCAGYHMAPCNPMRPPIGVADASDLPDPEPCGCEESVALRAKLAKAERAVECVTKVVRRWRNADTEGKNVMLAHLEWALARTEVVEP